MITVDASVIVSILINSQGSPEASEIFESGPLMAPHLIDLEAASAFKRMERSEVIDRGRAESLVFDLLRMPIRRVDHRSLLGRAWEHRHNLSVYDAVYIALAELTDTVLYTLDSAMLDVPGARCEVKLLV